MTLNVLGVLDKDTYIAPPYDALQEVIDVDVMLSESLLPSAPFKHVPFPDEYDIRENEHPLSVVLVVEEVPPATLTIDPLTLAALDPPDVTLTDVNDNDPFDI